MSNQTLLQTPTLKAWLTSHFLSSLATQTLQLIVMWQIYDITKSPLALGFVGLAEALPYIAVGLWAGHAADRYEKKRLIISSKFGLIASTLGLLMLSRGAHVYVLPIYIVLGLSSIASSVEQPASSAYLQMLVSKEHFSQAAAWNLTQFQIATIGGPIFGGYLISRAGVVAAYSVVLALYVGAMVFSTGLSRMEPVSSDVQEHAWAAIKTGLRFLMHKQIIFACMLLDMLAVLFGDVVAILPVFAAMYGAGPVGLGLMRSAPAIGSCITSILEARRPFIPIAWGSLLKVVIVFGGCIIAFALSHNFYLAVFFLIGGGLADGVSVIVRQSVYQANTPDGLRGRVAAVSGMFIRVSNELGAFESGLAAQLLGAVPSVIMGGSLTMVVAFLMWLKYRNVDIETNAAVR
jgi:MFS family permease